MDPGEYLQHLFGYAEPGDPRADDLVRFATVPRDRSQPDETKTFTRDELHTLDRHDLGALGLDFKNANLFFSPVLANADACAFAWVSTTNSTIVFEDIKPRPAYIIQSAPERFDVLWQLREPVPVAVVAEINAALARRLGGRVLDWLRLPSSTNFDGAKPFPVQFIYTGSSSYDANDFGVSSARSHFSA